MQSQEAFRIAQEFGLNRKQRLAFYIFANGLLAQYGPDPPAEALRLYIGGGAGTGKNHCLRAIKAFIACPAVKRLVPKARLLSVAFQGKQAAAVGGTTLHSVCPKPDDDGCLSGNHEGQKALDADKAAHWKGEVVLAIEEISMIGCKLLGRLHNTACFMFPLHKGKPFGNRIVVMLGDFNQLK